MSKEKQNKEHKGQPSGTNKSEGTGLSSTMQNQNIKKDEKMTRKYIDGEGNLADNIHKMHPKRGYTFLKSVTSGYQLIHAYVRFDNGYCFKQLITNNFFKLCQSK